MNEAVGNALLFKLAIAFIIILSALFLSSLAYTKAYKVKNKIIEEIEKSGEDSGREFTSLDNALNAFNTNTADEIEKWLVNGNNGKGIGYRKSSGKARCNYDKKGAELVQGVQSSYEYCVYQINTCTSTKGRCGVYYHVITYMYIDFPLVDQLPIAVHGETRTFTIQRN